MDIIDNFSKKNSQDRYFLKILKDKNCKFYKQDFTKIIDIKKFKKNYSFIFNFAAILGVKKVIDNPFDVLKDNILIHINSLEILKINKNSHFFFYIYK